MSHDHYDVIIIGSGAGGGTLAYRLAPSGKRILILERGDFLPRERENWSSDAVFGASRYKAPETWHDRDGKPFHPGIHYWVGGNTKMYGAVLLRLRERDFGAVHHADGVSPAWPLSYRDFAPYYTEAERLYHVHGQRGAIRPSRPATTRTPSGGIARAAHPTACRRSRARRATTRFRCRSASCSTREAARQRLHPLRDLRRVSVPGAGQGRRACRLHRCRPCGTRTSRC